MTREQLEQCLKAFPSVEPNSVHVAGDGSFVAKMTVRDFDELDDADRQERVYAFLRSQFASELHQVEFIIVDAPNDEQAQ